MWAGQALWNGYSLSEEQGEECAKPPSVRGCEEHWRATLSSPGPSDYMHERRAQVAPPSHFSELEVRLQVVGG